MKINLLPEVSITKKYRYLILFLILAIFISFNVFVFMQIIDKGHSLAEQKEILDKLSQTEETYKNQILLQKDEFLALNKYAKAIQSIEKNHFGWMNHLDQISKLLPKGSRITNLTWSDEGSISFSAQFRSIEEVGQFIQLVDQMKWVDHVDLSRIQDDSNNQTKLKQLFASTLYDTDITIYYTLDSLITEKEEKSNEN